MRSTPPTATSMASHVRRSGCSREEQPADDRDDDHLQVGDDRARDPAPTNWTPWWYRVRSLAKKTPAAIAMRWLRLVRGPWDRVSRQARIARNGSAYRQRNTVAVDGETPEYR